MHGEPAAVKLRGVRTLPFRPWARRSPARAAFRASDGARKNQWMRSFSPW